MQAAARLSSPLARYFGYLAMGLEQAATVRPKKPPARRAQGQGGWGVMPNIYIRTGPFDETPQPQGSFGKASDPWAAFPDAQPAAANMADPWAAYPDWPPQAPTYANDPSAAFPDATSRFSAPAMSDDPWAAYPDWPPAQASQGIDADLWAAYPDLHARFFGLQAPGNAPWSINELPPMGALYAAPTSFGEAAPLQTNSDPWAAFPDAPSQAPAYANDPWAAFPDWPPAKAPLGIDADLWAAYPDLHARFFALQAPANGSSGEGLLPSDTGLITGSIGNFSPLLEQQKLGDAIGADRNLYQAMYRSQPSVDPTLTQIVERNWACTNAAYTCLGNSTSPEMRQACLKAEKVCNVTIETLRSSPRALNVDTLITFPDGTRVVLQGGPDGAAYVVPFRRPGATSPGPMR